ncbi:hypothetical protein KIPB_007540, partial [Kipferlia bialata]|eukprot:g7540.t1
MAPRKRSRTKIYCHYCDVYLSVNTPTARNGHMTGVKHKMNVLAVWKKIMPKPDQPLPPGLP